MSYTIENLSFTIFGSGHDATLLDSGDGEIQVFSHPFVPLDSVHYAGMWYFTVADENGEPMDAVKDDLAHCEFTPAIGDTFDTEGDVTVECHYYREYINPESTIVVEKTVRQKITVVDHGTVVNAAHYNNSWNENIRCDIYSDGYVFFRPMTTTEVGAYPYVTDVSSGMVKVSSIPWRANRLGRNGVPLLKGTAFNDLSEFEYADVSNVKLITLLQNTYVEDLSPLSGWDVSNCESLKDFIAYNSKLTDLSPLADWNTSKVTTLYGAFCANMALTNLHGLENWDVSSVVDMYGMLSANEKLTDLTTLANWNTSNVENLAGFLNMYNANPQLTSLHGLENWDVSKVTDLNQFVRSCSRLTTLEALANWTPKPTSMWHFCSNTAVKSLDGLENFDMSNCLSLNAAFQNNYLLADCDAIADWDVSRCTNFSYMIDGAYWLPSYKAFENWSWRGDCRSALYGASVVSVDDVILDLSNVSQIGGMCYAQEKDYSSKLGKYVVKLGSVWYDSEGTRYTVGEVDDQDHPLVEVTRDASNAENWNVSGTNLGVFNTDRWANCPSWN
jgi:surface protein